MIRLKFLQPFLNICPFPCLIPHLLRPLIKILIRTYNPTAEINRRTTSQPSTARIINLLSLQVLLRCGLVAPVERRFRECEVETVSRDEVFGAYIRASGFE